MYRRVASLAVLALSSVWTLPAAAPDQASSQTAPKKEQKKPPSKAKDSTASMTGCVDEQDGKYVLLSEKSRDSIASLEADGFETEGFAKHVGQKVTVRGISNPGSTVRVFKVRAIETVSETCGPQSEK